MSVADFLSRLPETREIEAELQRCQDRQAVLRKLLKIAKEKEQAERLLEGDEGRQE